MHGTLPVSEEQALASLQTRAAADIGVAALSREWGRSRARVRSRLDSWCKSGQLPPIHQRPRVSRKRRAAKGAVAAAVEPSIPRIGRSDNVVSDRAPIASHASAAGEPIGPLLGVTIILAVVGIALAGVGMVETTAFAAKAGGLLFAALALCADAVVLLMPSSAAMLWRRRSPAVVAAVVLWIVASAVTIANLSGYIGSSDDQFRAAREGESTARVLTLQRLAQLRHERDAITEMRPVAALILAVNHARGWRKVALGEALAVARRRDALDAELPTAVSSIPDLPKITTVDPSANVLSDIIGATVSESGLRRLRLAALLALPLCGGFVLTVALNLLPRRGRRSEPALEPGSSGDERHPK